MNETVKEWLAKAEADFATARREQSTGSADIDECFVAFPNVDR